MADPLPRRAVPVRFNGRILGYWVTWHCGACVYRTMGAGVRVHWDASPA